MINQSKTFFAFAPASVGNFGPFYDVAGFCLQHLGDIVEARQKELAELAGGDLPEASAYAASLLDKQAA